MKGEHAESMNNDPGMQGGTTNEANDDQIKDGAELRPLEGSSRNQFDTAIPAQDFGRPQENPDMQWRDFMPPMTPDHSDPEAEQQASDTDTADLDNPTGGPDKQWKREMSPQMAELEK